MTEATGLLEEIEEGLAALAKTVAAVRRESLLRDQELDQIAAEADEMREAYDALADAWEAADALHREVHDRWPLVLCAEASCVALKDALAPGWREHRPPLTA